MKKALKVTFGTMLAASMASPTFANEYDVLQHLAVHVNGTYTKASENGLSYGDILQAPTQVGGGDGFRRQLFLHPDYEFDWGAGASYHIPRTFVRVFFHYDHFNDGNNTGGSTDTRDLGLGAPPPTSTAMASVHHTSNEFTLGIDRRINLGRRYHIDTAAFLEWDRIRRDMHEQNVNTAVFAFRDTENKMRGWGPGVGIKGHGLPFQCNNFGIFASAMATLLYSTNTFSQTEEGNNLLRYSYDPEDTHSIITKFDINFGVDYESVFRIDAGKMQAGIALGMRFVNYVNAFKNGNTFFNPEFTPGGTWAANTGHPEDWGRWGPFLQFRIGGAHA
ncbi:MAG: Lpg1974 family pore-forming outer membrane protein [Candidatus Berkiellales bacterium]